MRKWCRISKEIEFDAGHRVPNHKSKCRNIHGHRYRVRAVCRGCIIETVGAADEGMLIDFGDVKELLMALVHDPLDHGCILYRGDVGAIMAIEGLGEEGDPPQKVIEFPYIPTAENIARWCYDQLSPKIDNEHLKLDHIEVYETPTSMACYPELMR